MIERYLQAFTHLNRAPGRVWTSATQNRAPHKPLLLLALLDLFCQGQLKINFIELTPDLSELFTLYWARVVPPGQRSSVAFPFFHLKKEGFWQLVPVPGKEQVLISTTSISSVSQLRDIVLGVRLDEEFFVLLQERKNRDILRAALITANFGEEVRSSLVEQGAVNAEAFVYSMHLFEKAHGKIEEQPGDYKPAVRNQSGAPGTVLLYCIRTGTRIMGGYVLKTLTNHEPFTRGFQCQTFKKVLL